jgi:hypothetical protein
MRRMPGCAPPVRMRHELDVVVEIPHMPGRATLLPSEPKSGPWGTTS